MEIWKVIDRQPNYEVSNKGRIRRISTGRVLNPRFQVNGYLRVNFGKDTQLVHRLVATAFLAPDLSRPTVNHLDGIKTNNCDTNLAWATLRENNAHSAHKRVAANNPRRAMKLTAENVREIRAAHAAGDISSAIGERFDVTAATVRNIVFGRSWKELIF